MGGLYDNQGFFDMYRELRQRPDNFNTLLEQPAMAALLPEVSGGAVLDLGCGYGQNCRDFISRGAVSVLGVDLSARMLEVAAAENAHPSITYRHMDMAALHTLSGAFDLVYSSLAFHYVEDFRALIGAITTLLAPGGTLLFSQEHPIATATEAGGGDYTYGDRGEALRYCFSDYAKGGRRVALWGGYEVPKYHRTLGDILTTVADAGLRIERVVEPVPEAWAARCLPQLENEFIKPSFLLIRAAKPQNGDGRTS